MVDIPERHNKVDQPPPHAQFEVKIWNSGDKLCIIASNPKDMMDFFEINVDGFNEVEGVLKKFEYNYLHIVEQLRLMNDVMVLLNPKISQPPTSRPK